MTTRLIRQDSSSKVRSTFKVDRVCDLRYATIDSLRMSSNDDFEEWLTPTEREELDRYRDAKRRESWLCGRRLAKEMILDCHGVDSKQLSCIEILTRNSQGQGIRPRVTIQGESILGCLSIAHSDKGVLAAFTLSPSITVGVDLTPIDSVTPGFAKVWFSPHEQESVSDDSTKEVATIWSAKEAVYKACNDGIEPFRPRRIEIEFDDAGGGRGQYDDRGSTIICGLHYWSIDSQMAAFGVTPTTTELSFRCDSVTESLIDPNRDQATSK